MHERHEHLPEDGASAILDPHTRIAG